MRKDLKIRIMKGNYCINELNKTGFSLIGGIIPEFSEDDFNVKKI